ncbi:hypothetical protein KC901_00515 [Patescibacteria group bacterium]|nr:hypothetical protein [Patescibacteria group bacterium]
MNTHHKSHHIFAYLGILLLIFVVFFGVRYFQSEYTFENILVGKSAQSYEDGEVTANPFFPDPDHMMTGYTSDHWVTFGSKKFSFAYPSEYALRILNDARVEIIPSSLSHTASSCDSGDEQERSLCLHPPRSPHITVSYENLENTIDSNPPFESFTIGDLNIMRKQYEDEYGGSVWYYDQNRSILVTYDYDDVVGGQSFDTLHQTYGDQYQLDAGMQNKLALEILKSIEVK